MAGLHEEGKGPQRRPQKRLGRRLEEVAKAVGGRLLSVTNAIEAGTLPLGSALAGRPRGGKEGAGTPPPSNASLWVGGVVLKRENKEKMPASSPSKRSRAPAVGLRGQTGLG